MAVVRVKRRLQDDPIEVLFLTCKKLKTDEGPTTEIFKFAATVPHQDDDITTQIKEVFSNNQANNKQQTVENITNKMRSENRMSSRTNRLKVVNCFRAIGKDVEENVESEVGDVGKTLTVLDMEDLGDKIPDQESKDSGKENLTSDQFVYDLYYANTPDFNDLLLEQILSGNIEFSFENRNDEDEDDNVIDDEDDSNDENNWRNDYPDEDDFSSESGVDDGGSLAKRMGNFTIEDRSLSSDEGEEELVFGDEVEASDIFDYNNDYDSFHQSRSRFSDEEEGSDDEDFEFAEDHIGAG